MTYIYDNCLLPLFVGLVILATYMLQWAPANSTASWELHSVWIHPIFSWVKGALCKRSCTASTARANLFRSILHRTVWTQNLSISFNKITFLIFKSTQFGLQRDSDFFFSNCVKIFCLKFSSISTQGQDVVTPSNNHFSVEAPGLCQWGRWGYQLTENWMEAISPHHVRHETALKFGTLSSQNITDLALVWWHFTLTSLWAT